jgi:hypothetical protein
VLAVVNLRSSIHANVSFIADSYFWQRNVDEFTMERISLEAGREFGSSSTGARPIAGTFAGSWGQKDENRSDF